MLLVEFKIDPAVVAEAGRIQTRFPQIVNPAILQSLRRAATAARKVVVNDLVAWVNIKRGTLTAKHRLGYGGKGRSIVDVVNPTGITDRATAGVSISERRIPLIRFKAKMQRGKGRAWSRGVRYAIIKGDDQYVREAFIAQTRKGKAKSASEAASGHVGVFARRGRKRLPIDQLMGPSMAYLVQGNEKIKADLRDALLATFNERMKHELQFRLAKELFPAAMKKKGA